MQATTEQRKEKKKNEWIENQCNCKHTTATTAARTTRLANMIDGWVWGPYACSPIHPSRPFIRPAHPYVVLAFLVQIIDQIFMQTQRRNECKSRQLLAQLWVEQSGLGSGATAMHNWVNLTCSCRSNSWRLRRVAIFGSRARVARQKSNGMGEWATGRMNVNVQNLYCDICNDFSRWAAAGQTNKLQAMQ